jgi:ABC-2 type transport system ATP-binding protein
MQEVEAICDKVIIINKGEIIADENAGNISSLGQKSFQTIQVEVDKEISEKKLLEIRNVDKVKNISHSTWLLESNSTEDIRPAIFDYCVAHNLKVLSLQKMNKKLEEVFRELTK